MEDLPGGIQGLADAIARLHARGVRAGARWCLRASLAHVFLLTAPEGCRPPLQPLGHRHQPVRCDSAPPAPSHTPTRPPSPAAGLSDPDAIAALGASVKVDFVNGDTMSDIGAPFWAASVAAGNPIAFQPEGGCTIATLQWVKMGWGEGWPGTFIPSVDAGRWTETRHESQVCNRWATDHTTDLQQALFNGDGFVTWENVWGIWNGLSQRDSAATRRVGALLRFLAPFLTSPDWEPHVILNIPLDQPASLFASRWPAPAGGPFPHNSTAWTLVNRGGVNVSAAPLVFVPCSGASIYDLYAGVQVRRTMVRVCALPSAPPPSPACAAAHPRAGVGQRRVRGAAGARGGGLRSGPGHRPGRCDARPRGLPHEHGRPDRARPRQL